MGFSLYKTIMYSKFYKEFEKLSSPVHMNWKSAGSADARFFFWYVYPTVFIQQKSV